VLNLRAGVDQTLFGVDVRCILPFLVGNTCWCCVLAIDSAELHIRVPVANSGENTAGVGKGRRGILSFKMAWEIGLHVAGF